MQRRYLAACVVWLACNNATSSILPVADGPAPTIDAAPDPGSSDSDGDGIPDEAEGRWAPGGATDSDGDGTPDFEDPDADNDGLLDREEEDGDWDNDMMPNRVDPTNDSLPTALTFTAISTPFNSPVGIDFHEPTKTVAMSVNYPSGTPYNFELVQANGDHTALSTFSGMTDEVKIATVRSMLAGGYAPNPAAAAGPSFAAGTMFTGNGLDGQIVRISADGSVIDNPWVNLHDFEAAGTRGLMRGSLYADRTGLYNGDLVVATTAGEVWRVNAQRQAHKLAAVGTHLEGLVIVPDAPRRFGALAGKILAGAEQQNRLYVFDGLGTTTTYDIGVAIEDLDLVMPRENFFGINYGTSRLLGVEAAQLRPLIGDILIAQEYVASGTSGLFRLKWDNDHPAAEPVPLGDGSAAIGQWEHVTTAYAGIREVPIE